MSATRTPALTFATIAHMQGANSRHMVGALRELGESNLRDKRRRLAREGMARVAQANRRPAPGTIGEPVRPVDAPVSFRTGRKPRRVERAAKTIYEAATGQPTPVPEGARPETEPTPVKVGDLPKQARELARIAKESGHLSREWLSLGAVERDGKDVPVYARLHGNSVRYAVAA